MFGTAFAVDSCITLTGFEKLKNDCAPQESSPQRLHHVKDWRGRS
jgi:hypothetical protein